MSFVELQFKDQTKVVKTFKNTITKCNNQLILFGGTDGEKFYNTIYSYDLINDTWKEIETINK